jgi:hypothetical protein
MRDAFAAQDREIAAQDRHQLNRSQFSDWGGGLSPSGMAIVLFSAPLELPISREQIAGRSAFDKRNGVRLF